MKINITLNILFVLAFTICAASATELPKHQLPTSSDGGAKSAALRMLKAWAEQHPGVKWELADNDSTKKGEAAKQSPSAEDLNEKATREAAKEKVTHQQGAYSNDSARDLQTWDLEQTKLIARGKELFHDGTKLGGTTGIACAMCHPDAANTHPETYPKFQVQLQRVAMLRDMINWCMENPLKAKLLKDDDPKMHALEAYIIFQRKGTPLMPGKR